MVNKRVNKVFVIHSPFRVMTTLKVKTNLGIDVELCVFNSGGVLIHQCKSVVIYDNDVKEINVCQSETQGEYCEYIFEEK